MMATLVENTKSHAYRVGGVDDHVHLPIRLHPTLAGVQRVNVLKTQSSQWINVHGFCLGGRIRAFELEAPAFSMAEPQQVHLRAGGAVRINKARTFVFTSTLSSVK